MMRGSTLHFTVEFPCAGRLSSISQQVDPPSSNLRSCSNCNQQVASYMVRHRYRRGIFTTYTSCSCMVVWYLSRNAAGLSATTTDGQLHRLTRPTACRAVATAIVESGRFGLRSRQSSPVRLRWMPVSSRLLTAPCHSRCSRSSSSGSRLSPLHFSSPSGRPENQFFCLLHAKSCFLFRCCFFSRVICTLTECGYLSRQAILSPPS